MGAAMIERARRLVANPTLNRNIILNSHAAASAIHQPWIGSLARRIVAPVCGEFACELFTGRSSGDALPRQ
jgi:hypothetical protein